MSDDPRPHISEPPSHLVHDTFPAERLRAFTSEVFQALDVPAAEAERAAEILTSADLRGIDSHGIARLPTYVKFLREGEINPRPRITVVHETATTATIDGDRGLGLVVGPWANRLVMEKADRAGAGWAAVRRSNHFGIAGYYPMQALERDLVGWAMTNAGNLVTPFGGAERMLGTNPLAIAFPGYEEPPIVIDMATSAVAYGKIQIARRTHRPIPEGWVIDADGYHTDDPDAMLEGGALLPLGYGGAGVGHKGFCLSVMVDVLCGVLPGAGWGPFAPQFALRHAKDDHPGGTGHFFGALKVDGFMDPEEFRRNVDAWIRTLRSTRAVPGTPGPLIPGDPERFSEEHRRVHGVPLVERIVEDLREVGRALGIPF